MLQYFNNNALYYTVVALTVLNARFFLKCEKNNIIS